MLEDDRVAQRDVRGSEARHLVVGVVPWHDADERADRLSPNDGRAGSADCEGVVCRVLRRMVGVVLIDRGDQRHLALGLRDRLTHFDGEELGQLVGLRTVDLGGSGEHGDTLLHRCGPPGAVRRRAACDEIAELGIRDFRVLGELFAGGRVDGAVDTHGWFSWCVR